MRGFLPALHSVKGDLRVKSAYLGRVVISRDAGPNGKPESLSAGSVPILDRFEISYELSVVDCPRKKK